VAERLSQEYTLELAEEHIANANGNIDRLNEIHAFGDSQVPNTPGTGNGSALYSVAGTAQHITEAGLAGGVPLGQANTANIIVTQATAQALSRTFTIPAGDANVGTVYRITAFGNGQWGSTQQAFAYGIGFPGTTEFSTHHAVNASAFGASVTFRWAAILWVVCETTGVSGTWNGHLMLNMTQTANSAGLFTAATQSLGLAQGPNTDITQDTTIDNNFCMLGWWGSTTGSPTITTRSSFFERLGP
jgi:hypothetical protein